LIELNSSAEFDANLIQKLTSDDIRLQFAHKRYTNQDFHDFKKVTLEDDLSDDNEDGLEEFAEVETIEKSKKISIKGAYKMKP